ncbi:MAG: hypothetical protein M0006_15855 [Magnetospirillum sp.]|nr:hypothetical protein [Magnetospirillum sp.]
MSRHTLLATISALALAGCGAITNVADTDFQTVRAQSALLTNLAPPSAIQAARGLHPSTPYLGVMKATEDHGDPLPPMCRNFTLKKTTSYTLSQLDDAITRGTGIPVDADPAFFRPDLPTADLPQRAQPTSAALPIVTTDSAHTPLTGFPFNGRAPVMSSGLSATLPAADQPFVANYEGGCSSLFDQMAKHFDATWRYENGRLIFTHIISQMFPIKASVLSSKLHADIAATASASGSTQAGSTATNQSSTVDSTAPDIWKEIDNELGKILSKHAYSISKATNTVIVRTTPSKMREVRDYLGEINAILSVNVYVQVTAFYVTVTDTDTYGFDLNALWTAGQNGGLQLGLASVLPTLATAAGTGSLAILSPTNGSSAHLAGTQVFANALSQTGHLAEVRTGYALCKNGTPTPISMTTDQDIVTQIAFNTVAQAGTASTTATATTINYGFSLQVIPRVVSPTEVDLFYTFNETDLDNLTNYSLGASGSLELATMDKRNLWNDMVLHSGQTLITAGTEQNRLQHDKTGIGDANFWGAGGSSNAKVIRTRLILLVTPTIVPRGTSPEMARYTNSVVNNTGGSGHIQPETPAP